MEIIKKWFADETPVNAKKATAEIGTGEDGTITIECDSVGTEGNGYEVAVVIATGANKAMTVALANGVITVTLGTGADSNVATAKNTATLIATEISKISGFTAVASGEGTSSISQATAENVAFDGGQYGTICINPEAVVYISPYYYTVVAPNGILDANWRRFQLGTY